MLATLFAGLVMASGTPMVCPAPIVSSSKMNAFYRTQVEEFNLKVQTCEADILTEKTKICDREFDRRSSHGEAKFDVAGKKYKNSELTCKVTCSDGYYLTKGGMCRAQRR